MVRQVEDFGFEFKAVCLFQRYRFRKRQIESRKWRSDHRISPSGAESIGYWSSKSAGVKPGRWSTSFISCAAPRQDSCMASRIRIDEYGPGCLRVCNRIGPIKRSKICARRALRYGAVHGEGAAGLDC